MSVLSMDEYLEHEDEDENWRRINGFDYYMVSDCGRVQAGRTGRMLSLTQNQYGVVQVGMMRDGTQHHRSVPLLVAKAFISKPFPAFDTPINRDGDRWNNMISNLLWRPRWFAVKYNYQFKFLYPHSIDRLIQDIKTGEVSENSLECAVAYGLLEEDLVTSILNRTYVWPTYQQFSVYE